MLTLAQAAGTYSEPKILLNNLSLGCSTPDFVCHVPNLSIVRDLCVLADNFFSDHLPLLLTLTRDTTTTFHNENNKVCIQKFIWNETYPVNFAQKLDNSERVNIGVSWQLL